MSFMTNWHVFTSGKLQQTASHEWILFLRLPSSGAGAATASATTSVVVVVSYS